MFDTYLDIVLDNARDYHHKAKIGLGGAILKSSLIPLELLDGFINGDERIVDFGCGEGMFSNALARLFPESSVYGVDIDKAKIDMATECQQENATFSYGDAVQCQLKDADVAVFNDMLHHNAYTKQEELLAHVHKQVLKKCGILVIKEVDAKDKLDARLTTFFDSKLYPDDVLCFRSKDEWISLLESGGFRVLAIRKISHPWIASRTLFIAEKLSSVSWIESKDDPKMPTKGKDEVFVLLTGATGFIGQHMVRHLLQSGLNGKQVRPILVARSPYRIPEELRDRVSIIKKDLVDIASVSNWKIFKEIDYVFHFAAEVKIHGDPGILYRNNVEATRQLISLFNGSRCLKRFIHASTVGAVDRRPDDTCESPLDESIPPHPLTTYGKTKREAEDLVKGSNLPYTIVRIPWAFGSHMTPDTHVRNLFERVKKNSFATRFAFPGKVSVIAVEDLVCAFEKVSTHPDALNNIFYVAGHDPVALGDLFRRMSHYSVGTHAGTIPIPKIISFGAKKLRRFFPLTIQNLNSDVLCVSYKKIAALGYKPSFSLDDSLIRLSHSIRKESRPKHETIVVTGAGSGIGRELIYKLVAQGYQVMMVDKNLEALTKLKEALHVPYWHMDLAHADDVNTLVSNMENEVHLFGLINCAGIGHRTNITDLSSEKISEIIAVNASSLSILSSTALRRFKKQKRGILVNVSSSSALQPFPFFSIYSSTKAYVSQFTESIIYEFRNERRIRIYNVIPSGTATNFQQASNIVRNPAEKLLSPAYVADEIMKLVVANKKSGSYFVGNRGRVMFLMDKILPRSVNRKLWGTLIEKTR